MLKCRCPSGDELDESFGTYLIRRSCKDAPDAMIYQLRLSSVLAQLKD